MRFCILILLSLFALPVAGETAVAGQIPASYAECDAANSYTVKNALLCTYFVPENKKEPGKIKDYLACQRSKPNHQYLQTYDCKYTFPDDMDGPAFVSCEREHMPTQYPGFNDDCRLFFYNPDYVFPKSFEECMKREEHKEDVTYTALEKICRITVSYAPETGKEHYDKEAANRLIEKCQIAGGKAHVVDNRHPVCILDFIEK